MKVSIKIKFSIFLGVFLLLMVSVLNIFVLNSVEKKQKKEYETYLAHQVRFVNTYIQQLLTTEEVEANFLQKNAPQLLSQTLSVSSLKAAIYDMEGKEMGNSLYGPKVVLKDLLGHALQGEIAYQIIDENVVYVAPLYGEKQIGVIQLQYSLKKDVEFYEDMKKLFFKAGAVVFLLSFFIVYWYFNHFSKYIIKLKNHTQSIIKGNYEDVEIIKRNDELGALSEGIYFMSHQIQTHIVGIEKEKEKLKLAIEKLKALEQQQQVFIGNVTHEFKTPLTVIRTYIDLLDMYPEDTQLVEDAKININKETKRLQGMVENTLSLSRLQKYDFEFQWEKVDIKIILEEVCTCLEGKAKKYNISLIRALESGLIWGDKENLMHIFINLIDNAIKYNVNGGKIFVSSSISGSTVRIKVIDTGIGIPIEAREKIFEPFFTIKQNQSVIHEGTGLGLSVVKELVEKQNGTIELVDTKQNGTNFLICFPAL